tara:strand:+ start:161 stop:655 length:495 start_codon:yes stop_codon:yes gene_type:complete
MNPVKTLESVFKNPTKPETWKKFALGQKGVMGVVASTAVLEFLTQGIEAFIPQSRKVLGMAPSILQNKMTRVPNVFGIPQSLNVLDVRDMIVLAPAIVATIAIFKDKTKWKKHAFEAGAGFSTKAIMRITGLNPSLLSRGSKTSAQNPRVTAGGGLASNMGVTP